VSGTDSSGWYNASGVYGSSSAGNGVYGTGSNKGVYGLTSVAGPTHAGVFGENSAVGGTAVVGNALAINSSGVAGVADTAGSTGVYARGNTWAGFFQGNVNVTGAESFGSATRQMLNLWGATYGIGVQNSAFYQRTASEFFWYKGGAHSDTFGDPGAGGTQLMRLGNAGDLIVTHSVTTPILTITGGADVAEPFKMSTSEIPKGAVVVIDENSPGHLKMSNRPYDQRVAGIVSGANGIKPGISLSQQELNEGGQNVALSGRVYVLADASGGAIKPGDLLTTSNTPGHAMKVINHSRSQGAILGKAMSSLREGKGMVLVLVTLQ
jgi:hypothetical protein